MWQIFPLASWFWFQRRVVHRMCTELREMKMQQGDFKELVKWQSLNDWQLPTNAKRCQCPQNHPLLQRNCILCKSFLSGGFILIDVCFIRSTLWLEPPLLFRWHLLFGLFSAILPHYLCPSGPAAFQILLVATAWVYCHYHDLLRTHLKKTILTHP